MRRSQVPSRPEKAGQLRAADPFDLIRLLARSQHDPRKAVAELVQNSLDASATHVLVVRYQTRGTRCLSVRDDGDGVLPGLPRKEALAYIATNIGHSIKRELSIEERYRLLLQGKYGIGLLGFWSVGRRLDMRSKLGDEPAFVLRLEEDSPRYEIHRDRRELELGDRWTEVVIVGLHETASRQLGGRRLSDYLADELRGQLLGRGVELRVVDQVARGRARREFLVTPRRFEGVPLTELSALDVEGQGRARLELCYVPPGLAEPGHVALAASGTLVVEDLGTVSGLDHPPWTSGCLVGVVDFPPLEVAPGSRRGFVPNVAAAALVAALRAAEPALAQALSKFEEERRRQSDEELLRQLRRLFSDFGRRLPHYELFEVAGPDSPAGTRSASDAGPGEPASAAEAPPSAPGPADPGAVLDEDNGDNGPSDSGDNGPSDDGESEPAAPQIELFPPGPLASVSIQPAGGELEARRARRLRAVSRDAGGRRIDAGVTVHWRVEQGWALARVIALDDGAALAAPRAGLDVLDGGRGVRLLAGDSPGTVVVAVLAVEGEQRAEATATFEVVPGQSAGHDLGIPEPHPVHAPGEPWRSRVLDGRWEYNSGHADYLATVGDAQRKLRYIATLLAKEIVFRRTQRPEAGVVMEQMVEVLCWVERKLARAARGKR